MKTDAPSGKIRIMLIEDHVLVRMGLVAAVNSEPDIEVVAEVEDGNQAVEVYEAQCPDVVVLDLRMPGCDGIEIIKALRSKFGPVKILMLSSFGSGDDIARAMGEGAAGYVVKGMDVQHLLNGIRTVHAGGKYLPPEISSRMSDRISSELSAREVQVLQLIAKGKSNKEIAAILGIVLGTAKAHVASILTKLGAVDRAQATAIAVQRQILRLE